MSAHPTMEEVGGKLGAEHYSKLLEVIHELKGELEQEDIPVPGIVVCGKQSCGKSSVLEALTGVRFPTGLGTCTRRPIVVQMVPGPHRITIESAGIGEDVSEDDLPRRLDQFQRALAPRDPGAGGLGDFVEDPINLTISRPGETPLRLTDLPGIVANDKDKEAITKNIVREHIRNEATVIVIVSEATEDYQNVSVYQLAREVDPSGQRTVGVLTKADRLVNEQSALKANVVQFIAERGTGDASLREGYVLVRTRKGQEDEHRTKEEMHQIEVDLFSNDPHFSRLDHSQCGIESLRRLLVRIQNSFLDNFQSNICKELGARIRQLEVELGRIPTPSLLPVEYKQKFFHGLSAAYKRTTKDRIPHHMERGKNLGGEFDRLGDAYKVRLADVINPIRFITDEGFLTDFKHRLIERGHLSEMDSLVLFESVVRSDIVRHLQSESLDFVDRVCGLVQRWLVLLDGLDLPFGDQFPELLQHTTHALHQYADEAKRATTDALQLLFDAESEYPRFGEKYGKPTDDVTFGTNAAEFMASLTDVQPDQLQIIFATVESICSGDAASALQMMYHSAKPLPAAPSANIDPQIENAVYQLKGRADEIIRNYGNMVPRIVWTNLVWRMLASIEDLNMKLGLDEQLLESLMQEDPAVRNRRDHLATKKQRCERCLKSLQINI